MGLKRLLGMLFVVVALLGGGWAALNWTSADADDGVEPMESVLGGRSVVAASRIVIQNDPQQAKIEIERGDDGTYRMVEPLQDLASPAMLDNIRRVYDGARMQLLFAPDDVTDAVLRDREFEPGRGSVRFEWSDGHAFEMQFGGRGAIGDGMFIRVDGGIYTTSAALLSCLQAGMADYRDPYVFQNKLSQVQRFKLTRRAKDGAESELAFRRDSMAFRIEGREDLDLAQGVVKEMLESILAIRVHGFMQGRRNTGVGPRTPDYVIEVEGARGKDRVELFLDAQESRLVGWATPRDIEFSAKAAKYRAALEIALRTLRSHWLFPRSMLDELERMTIGVPGASSPLSLENRSGDFYLVSPIQFLANPTTVSEVLAKLRELAILDFVEDDSEDLARYGLAENFLTLRLRQRWQREDVELHIGNRTPEFTYLRRADSRHVVAVANDTVELLSRAWIEYVSLELPRIRVGASVQRIRVAKGDGSVLYVRNAEGDWARDGSEEIDDRVADAFDTAREFNGRRAIERASIASQLGPPVTLSFETAQGRVLSGLEVFEQGGSWFVAVPDAPVVYEVRALVARYLVAIAPG